MSGGLDVGTVSGALEMRDNATALVRRFGLQLAGLEKQLAATEAATQRLNLGAALQGMSSKAMLVGGALTAGVTIPLAMVAKATTDLSAEFERTMTKLVTLAGVSEQQMRAWHGTVLDMAGDVGVGPNELSRALYVVASAGERSSRALEIVRQSAQASATGLGETATIARTVTAAMAAYASTGLTAQQAVDTLTATVREGNMEADELAGTLGRVVGIAAQVGVSFQQVGSYMATFSRLGVNSSEAVTALRGTLNTFLKTGDEARRTLEAYGLSAEQLRQTIREDGLAAALGLLVDTFKGNEDALSKVIPNVRALAGVLGTAGVQGQSYREILKSLEASHNTTAEGFKRTTETMAFGWAQLTAESEALAIKMGDRLAPAMREVQEAAKPTLDAIVSLVDGFAALPDGVQQTAVGFALLVGPLTFLSGLLVKAGGLLSGLWGLLSQGLTWLLTGSRAVISFGTSFEMLGPSIGAVALRLTGIVGLFAGFNALLWQATNSTNEYVRAAAAASGPIGGLMRVVRDLKVYFLDAVPAIDEAERRLTRFAIAQQKALAQREFGQDGKFTVPDFAGAQRNYQEMLADALKPRTGQRTWENELSAAREQLAKLDPAVRASMRSFYELTGSQEKLAEKFGLSETAAAVFARQMGETKRGATEAAKAYDALADVIKDLGGQEVVENAERVARALGTGISLSPEKAQAALDTLNAGIAELSRRGQPVTDEMRAWVEHLQRIVTLEQWATNLMNQYAQAADRVQIPDAPLPAFNWPALIGDRANGGIFDPDSVVPGVTMAQLGEEAANRWFAGWTASGIGDLVGDSLVRALQGGGDVAKSIGAAVGQSIGQELANGIVARLGEGTFSRLAGGVLSAVLPGIGGWLGGMVGGLFSRLFGPSEARKAADLRQQLIEQAGGLEKIREMADLAGVSLDRFLRARTQSDVRRELEAIQKAAEAAKERLAELVDEVGRLESAGGLISPDLLRRIMADSANADVRRAVDSFFRANTSRAVEGLSAYLQLRPTVLEGLETAQERVAELSREEADLVARVREYEARDHLTPEQARQLEETRQKLADIRAELAEAQSRVDRFGTALSQITLNPSTASALQAGLSGLFGDLLAQGASPVAALSQLAPAVQALGGQLEAAGLQGTPAFAELQRLVALVTSDVAGPLLTAIDGLGQGLVGLHNTGLLTSQMFTGLARGAYDAFHTLELQGRGGTDAVRAMQPTLQRIWELQQDFGYEVDESTQALLDFATEAGLVGDRFRPAQDQMVRALDALVSRFDTLITLFERLLPGAMESGADEINRALDSIDFEGMAQRGVAAFRDVEDAATATAWGHSPTGIKEIPIALDEAIRRLGEFGAYASQAFASAEEMATAYAHTSIASADDFGSIIQSLSYQLEDLTSTALQRTLNGIERDLARTIDSMGMFVNDPRYALARQLAEQVAELRGREAVAAERERAAASASAGSRGGEPQIEQILVVHLDGQVVTEAVIRGLPQRVRVLSR